MIASSVMMQIAVILALFTSGGTFAHGTFRTRPVPESVCADNGASRVGYFDFADDSKHLFYWLSESRNKPAEDPFVLWMSGGPGASSVGFGMFQELGSCLVKGQNKTEYNPFAWNNRANVLFVDQPVNVGFSHSEHPVATLDEAMNDMYTFLVAFMTEFPQYANQSFYIAAESYGGTWGPALARKIWTRQRSPMAQVVRSTSPVTDVYINLQGVALGNAQLSQDSQWPGFFSTGCLGEERIFNDTTCAIIETHLPQCDRLLHVCSESDRNRDVCDLVLDYCRQRSVFFILDEKRNPYDFRKTCEGDISECYAEHDWVRELLNSRDIKDVLGVPSDVSFELVDLELETRFMSTGQALYPSAAWAEELLQHGYRILVYAGDKDWFCNAAGERNLVNGFQWEHQASFQATELQRYMMRGHDIGVFKQFKRLTYAEIFDAGHMVPHDKPEEALFLIDSWLQNGLEST